MQEAKQKKIAHFCSIDELRRLVLWMRCQCTCARRQAEFFHYACIRMPEVAIARSHRDCASRTTLHPSFDPVVRHRRWEASDAIDCIYHRDGMRVVCVCVCECESVLAPPLILLNASFYLANSKIIRCVRGVGMVAPHCPAHAHRSVYSYDSKWISA